MTPNGPRAHRRDAITALGVTAALMFAAASAMMATHLRIPGLLMYLAGVAVFIAAVTLTIRGSRS